MYQLREQNAQLARAVAARYHTDKAFMMLRWNVSVLYSVKHYAIKVYRSSGVTYAALQYIVFCRQVC